MFTFAYPAVFKRDEDKRFLVSFPDFPTAHTDGADANEAMEEAIDCLGSSIGFAMADKADVPKPSRLKRGQKSYLCRYESWASWPPTGRFVKSESANPNWHAG